MSETPSRLQSQHHVLDVVRRVAARIPDHQAIVAAGGREKAYTFQEVVRSAEAVAGTLQQAPFADESAIGIIAENRPEWTIAYLGILGAGKTVVPLDANMTPHEVTTLIERAALKTVFASQNHFRSVVDTGADFKVITFDKTESDPGNVYSFAALEQRGDSYNRSGQYATDLAALIYTSGTTGQPKAVQLTHTNLVTNIKQIQDTLHFDENDTFLSLLPLHHTFEATVGFLATMCSGSRVVYARSLKSREIVEDIAANGVTIMCGVPLLYEKMYQGIERKIRSAPVARRLLFRLLFAVSSLGWILGRRWGVSLFRSLRKKGGLDKIRMFVSGGAAVPAHIARFFNLIGFNFLPGYGLTECAPVVSVNRPEDTRFSSSGPPLVGVEVAVHNPGPDGIGEIIVKGPNNTPGYLNNPEATRTLLRAGWLHTGDLGHLKDGHVFITGRAKNLIVSAAGKNIYPEEIEEKLVASDLILEAVVFGRKKEGRQGEDVRAVVVPDLEYLAAELGVDPAQPEPRQVRDLLSSELSRINENMAGYKRIVDWELSFDELEKTSTRKIKRYRYR